MILNIKEQYEYYLFRLYKFMCENKIISEIFTFKYSSNIFTNCVLVLLSYFNRCFLATIPS